MQRIKTHMIPEEDIQVLNAITERPSTSRELSEKLGFNVTPSIYRLKKWYFINKIGRKKNGDRIWERCI